MSEEMTEDQTPVGRASNVECGDTQDCKSYVIKFVYHTGCRATWEIIKHNS